MARTTSQELARNMPAPEFDLADAHPHENGAGRRVALSDYAGTDVLVVIFTCNHCPYAQHVEGTLIRLANDFAGQGVRFVLISPNDPVAYPDDSLEAMRRRAAEKAYPFPYLLDETQQVARAYGAVCTPDPYVFRRHDDGVLRLEYHGQVDSSRPNAGVSTGDDLRRAIEDALAGRDLTFDAVPSVGCNIKWRQ